TMAFPAPACTIPPGLPGCDADCLRLLLTTRDQGPQPAHRIRKELDDRDIGAYGEATVNRALRRLKRRGLVVSSRKGHRLAGHVPLFNRRTQPGAVDRVGTLVSGHAEACLADLRKAGDIPRPFAAVADGGGWVVLTMAFPARPAPAAPPGLPE